VTRDIDFLEEEDEDKEGRGGGGMKGGKRRGR